MKRQLFGAGEAACGYCSCRRNALKTAIALGLSLPLLDVVAAADPKMAPPTPGDQFVFVLGDRKGEVIAAEDLPVGGPQELAYPMEPRSKVVRDGSRLNQVLLIRLAPADLTPDTRTNSADGIAAYSAICTHQGCDVSQWMVDKKVLLCVCHGSEFDPRDRAKVVFGPAPRRLAILPLTIQEGVLVVAGPFKGRPGLSDL